MFLTNWKMKKIKFILLSLFITSCIQSFGQDKVETQSKTKKFSENSGSLISKEFIDVGEFKKVKIKVIRLSDLISLKSIVSIRLETDITTKYSTDTKVATLDSDELKGLMTSIQIMQGKVFPSEPVNYTEISFTSLEGFEAGCFWSASKNKWSTYIKIDKYDGKSYVFLEVEDLSKFLELLKAAELIIDEQTNKL
jgi:hypothetical protein